MLDNATLEVIQKQTTFTQYMFLSIAIICLIVGIYLGLKGDWKGTVKNTDTEKNSFQKI